MRTFSSGMLFSFSSCTYSTESPQTKSLVLTKKKERKKENDLLNEEKKPYRVSARILVHNLIDKANQKTILLYLHLSTSLWLVLMTDANQALFQPTPISQFSKITLTTQPMKSIILKTKKQINHTANEVYNP